MRAAVSTTYGGPEIVKIREVPRPDIRPDDVLVKVAFSTVNRTDAHYRAGTPKPVRVVYGIRGPKVHILGCEFAGVVHATGREVTRFAIGDRVFGYNEGPFGAHAQYLSIRHDGPLAKIPENVAFEQAAASTEGSHYAHMMATKASVTVGQNVLVIGGTGGIGSAAVQLVAHLGARVTAVCATDHLDVVRGLGAERVIDYLTTDFTKDSQALSEGYDVIIDAVGKSTFGACRPLLMPQGVYVSSELGPMVQNPLLALVTPMLRGRRVIFPIPTHNQAMVEHFAGLLASGAFSPLIDRTYPLAEIAEAHRYVESGQKIGNVLIAL
jgi:NADPH:quinone reductase-like Zn-dependent oxidoreductase